MTTVLYCLIKKLKDPQQQQKTKTTVNKTDLDKKNYTLTDPHTENPGKQ
jgi:hypothetical protein